MKASRNRSRKSATVKESSWKINMEGEKIFFKEVSRKMKKTASLKHLERRYKNHLEIISVKHSFRKMYRDLTQLTLPTPMSVFIDTTFLSFPMYQF